MKQANDPGRGREKSEIKPRDRLAELEKLCLAGTLSGSGHLELLGRKHLMKEYCAEFDKLIESVLEQPRPAGTRPMIPPHFAEKLQKVICKYRLVDLPEEYDRKLAELDTLADEHPDTLKELAEIQLPPDFSTRVRTAIRKLPPKRGQ